MEKDRIAFCVESFKPSPFGHMRAVYPSSTSGFLPGVIPSRPEDFSVNLEQGIDEIFLKPPVCHVLARVHKLREISLEQEHPLGIIAETLSEKEHYGAGCHVVVEPAFIR
jgi:hypothetical protein